ncbi:MULTISPECIES: hypothetical protein [unclassified Curtobacterium]|uniref:hypothetical protein n=1 Tax=unclassified Curtobacterium TaxID=257496 RepID=UPI0010520789|nr:MULTISPECIES: hypothetical protein [unclassified Curtobacterium]TCL81127.1 hypothetical protein EDF23_101574 [Curtobacterium sp. PhB128]TCL99252.1 hypothetical protein EDF29_101575 [Curtobacterium sp. PhB138]
MHTNKSVLALVGALVVTLTSAGAVVQTAPAEAATPRISSACSSVPTTTTEFDGVPGPIFYKRLQCMASRAGYGGAIDGQMRSDAWFFVAKRLAVGGYYQSGDFYGSEHPQTIAALQRWAAAHGRYSGPIDGVWGPNSYRGAAWALNRAF